MIFIIHKESGKLSFLLAKNRFACKTLIAKGTPSLEPQAILLGVETLANVKEGLAGYACVNPIKFTDF